MLFNLINMTSFLGHQMVLSARIIRINHPSISEMRGTGDEQPIGAALGTTLAKCQMSFVPSLKKDSISSTARQIILHTYYLGCPAVHTSRHRWCSSLLEVAQPDPRHTSKHLGRMIGAGTLRILHMPAQGNLFLEL